MRKILLLFFVLSGLSFHILTPEVVAQGERPKPFVADRDHDVIICKECDLAIQFSKKTFVPVLVYVNTGESYFSSLKPLRSFQIYEDYSAISAKGPNRRIAVECFNHQQLPDASRDDLLFSQEFRQKNQPKKIEVSSEDFRKETGFEKISFNRMTHFSKWQAREKEEGTPEEVFYIYFWGTKDFSYFLAEKPNPVFWGQFGERAGRPKIHWVIQANSLSPSHPSVDLDDPLNRYYSW